MSMSIYQKTSGQAACMLETPRSFFAHISGGIASTMSPPSAFESLPIELVHQVCSYLLPSHDPDRSILDKNPPSPLIPLASTSRVFRDGVESYCRTTLLQWAPITKFDGKIPSSKKVKKSHRGLLLRFKKRRCVFCGKASQRKAILCTGFGCCSACDKKEWPDKITKTNAKKEYHLNEEQLFAEKGDGLPVINYGSYSVEGGAATMFLRSDVERLADAVHGDWKEHMKDRAEIAKRRKAEKHGRLVQLMYALNAGPTDYSQYNGSRH
ncbi:hypothetical protein BDV97DRAFT_422517 [Delphinella strobiligena]|nr:hypothetical protein BDV97DRAFT_422517 [Delphinella strobiligena]